MPTRRPQQQHGQHQNSDLQSRRGPTTPKDGLSPIQTGRGAGFGGFGRGEGGAFGGSKYSGALADGHQGRQPGAVGGGFSGVPKRQPRRDNTDESTRSTWRQARGGGSGGFEGVLGFGNSPSTPASAQPDQHLGGGELRQQQEKQPQPEDDRWNQKNWRRAPEADKHADSEPAQPPKEANQEQSAPAVPQTRTPVQEPREDLGSVNWLYRDPNGQEQGPFTGNQMHEWYSHSYFQDDLPIRRQNETSFQTLAELKAATGNAVQPFLSPVRPRLPPNLPIPSPALHQVVSPGAPSPGLHDSFGRLHIHPLSSQPTSPFQQTATSPYYQPQFGAAPTYPQQQWNAAPGPRMNGMYGSIGPGSAQGYPAYGAVNHQRPDMFAAAPIGQSPWGAPAPAHNNWQQPQQPQQQPQMALRNVMTNHEQEHGQHEQDQHHMQQQAQHQHYEQQPQQQQQQQSQQHQQESAPVQDSYFPEQEPAEPETTDAGAESEAEADFVEGVLEDHQDDSAEQEREEQAEEQHPEVEEEPEAVVAASVPKQSAWATPAKPAPASRKSSISAPTPAQATPSKLPPAHASLPPKPVAAEPEPVTPAKPSTPKPAPWAAKAPTSTGPSLREIQEAESRQAEARKQALAEARALASPAAHSSSEDVTGTMSWGLPGQGLKANNTGSSTPPAPAWGGASDGPKKTLKQIQEEEEKRKAKAEAHVRAAAASQKRGYADLAAHAVPTPAQAAAAAAQGWTTVGAAGKITAAPPKATPVTKAPVVAKPAASPSVAVPKPIKANGVEDGPSVEFIRWTKQALQGLTVPVDEFITMLLQFPIDPPASARADQLEIIADSVYASSSTLDGRRFAQEFMTRRKQDAQRAASGRPVQKISSLADVVKTQPKQPAADLGFKVVKKKGKKA